MPGMDKTGPLGTGPIGGGFGPCGGGVAGRGWGRGLGRGRGWMDATKPLSPDEEKTVLETEKAWLESKLEVAKLRLKEIDKQP